MRYARLLLSLGLLTPLPALAQEVPGPLRVYVVADGRFPPKKADDTTTDPEVLRDTRDKTDQHHDFITEQGLNPTLLIITRAEPTAEAAAARLAKELGTMYGERSLGNTSLIAPVVFATLDKEFAADQTRTPDGGFVRDVKAKQVRDLATAIGVPRIPFALAARTSDHLTKWGMTEGDETVVVLMNKLQVVKRWNFAANQFDDAALKAILDATRTEAAKR